MNKDGSYPLIGKCFIQLSLQVVYSIFILRIVDLCLFIVFIGEPDLLSKIYIRTRCFNDYVIYGGCLKCNNPDYSAKTQIFSRDDLYSDVLFD